MPHLIRSSFKRHRLAYISGTLMALVSSWIYLQIPVIVRITLNNLHENLLRNALFMIGLALVGSVFMFGQRLAVNAASRRMEAEIREALFSHLMHLPSRQHRQWKVGDIMARAVNDLQAVHMMVGPAFLYAVSTGSTMLIAIFQMLSIHPLLTLAALAPLPFIASMTRYYGLKIHLTYRDIQDHYSRMSGLIQEDFSRSDLIQGFGKEEVFDERFESVNVEYYRRNLVLIGLIARFFPLLRFFIAAGFILILFYGGLLLKQGVITFGHFTEFHIYLMRLVWPMIAFGWVVNLLQRGLASSRRIDTILSVQPDTPEPARVDLPDGDGRLEIKNLTTDFLKDISMVVEPGTWVGIAGPSGSGKTTLLNRVTRIEEPPPGTILLDGEDIRSLTLSRFYDVTGYVPQESFLFSASLEANIAFGKPGIDQEDIHQVSHMSGLHADLEQLPHGLDTLVGERGVTLSGGQKQRVAIARVLLRHPRLLILDDCLSSVDAETEQHILDQLRTSFSDTTTMMVSHRMKVFPFMDRIYLMDGGRIVGSGTHASLLESSELYRQLWELQKLQEELSSLAV